MSKSYSYAIYPAIGIARVGTSEKFYIGPEEANALPSNIDGSDFASTDFRDEEKRLKRQAAHFAIHYIGEDGVSIPLAIGDIIPVGDQERTVKDIKWTVHLANKKPIWYEFQTNQGEDGYGPNHPLRNSDVTGAKERQRMIIDPGARTVNQCLPTGKFDRSSTPDSENRFPPQNIKPYCIDTLGELQVITEQIGARNCNVGDLLVVGGHGHSGSQNEDIEIKTYANNNGWYDDTSDGSVTATILLDDGTEIGCAEIQAAWVICGPPAYAPQIPNLVTLYDTIFDIAVRKMNYRPDIFEGGMWKSGEGGFFPHFETHIQPILERGQTYPWVVAIPPKPHHFDMAMMGDSSIAMKGMRQRILDYLRAPNDENTLVDSSSGGTMMPYLAGDASIGPADKTPSKFLHLTDTQYFMLQQWADGYFTCGKENNPKKSYGDVITQGVLENCVGGAFSPGIEMTWVSRLVPIYSAPFRIRVKDDICYPLSLDWNPEAGLEPGDITKFMAIPWQADFNECSSQPIDGRTVWWWPAQRPLFVYTKVKDCVEPEGRTIWQMVQDKDVKQVPWVGTDYDINAQDFVSFASDNEMVKNWKNMGFVFNEGDKEKPLFVEVERELRRPGKKKDK